MTALYRHFGAFEMRADASGITDTLEPLDPGRDVLLALFKQAILSDLGPYWNVARTDTPFAAAAVVQDTWPGPLTPEVVKARKIDWPLLAVYRSGEAAVEQHTLEVDKITQEWAVDYVIGPLSPEDQRKLRDILQAVPKVLRETIRRRGHPDYASGALQFFEGTGRFAAVNLKSFEVGAAPFAGDSAPLYHAVSCVLETMEIDGPLAGAEATLDGMSMSLGLSGPEGTLPDAVSADSEAWPIDLED